jgi:hypothetical protein
MYPSLELTLLISALRAIVKKITARRSVTPAEYRNGRADSLYMILTGRHKRKEILSIKRIVLSILMMINGLISFIVGYKCSKITIVNNYALYPVVKNYMLYYFFSNVTPLNGKLSGLSIFVVVPFVPGLNI